MTIFWRVLIITGLFLQSSAVAQHPVVEVPNEIEFAGMTLKLTSAARKIIQKDVNDQLKYPKGLQVLVDRANLYFPLMEKVMEEENFPTDFKYLALQESSLRPDAVSSSNAVGYWQFKKESAIEVGLRVDNKVDERMNIVASTMGAIKYLRRNNQTFDNWIYSILSYNLGLTGAKNKVDQKYYGARTMTIDDKMHWYVLRFLAHKLAFQHAIGNSGNIDSVLMEYIDGANKSIHDIANQHQLDYNKIKIYNLWLKTEKVPDDKIYSVILSVPLSKKQEFIALTNTETKTEGKAKKESYATISDAPLKNNMAIMVVVNKTKVILSRRGDTPAKLAYKGEITREEFLRYNEMKSFEDVRSNTFYYLESKRNKAAVLFHVVQYGETVWDIAHNYGIKQQALRDKNRMDENEALVPGRVLYLRTRRPKNKPVEIRKVEMPKPVFIPVRDTLTADEIMEKYGPKDSSQVTSANDAPGLIWHTVAQGETMFAITKLYKVPTDSIMVWNNMPDYKLSIGQKLIVGKKSAEPEQMTHTVVAGETIYKIANLYKVSTKEIQDWNNKPDLNLKVGEKLIIKKKM